MDDAPWGFAPFQYGRWAYIGGGWGWIPGRVMARPVYSPALVVFAGGSGFSASMSFERGGGVAWFPLGPREVYRPAFRTSAQYLQNLNSDHATNINVTIVTIVNITNITYVNHTVVGAVTAVPHSAFISSHSVASSAVAINPGALRQAQVTGSTALVVPSRESVLSRSAVGTVLRPPSQVVNRTVISRTPPPPPPVPFAQRQPTPAGRWTASPWNSSIKPAPQPSCRCGPTPPPPGPCAPPREGLPTPKPMVDRVNPKPRRAPRPIPPMRQAP